jgi:hypothetical protein
VGVDRYVTQNMTVAQKNGARNYRKGQVLVFHRGTKEVGRTESLEVVRVERGGGDGEAGGMF